MIARDFPDDGKPKPCPVRPGVANGSNSRSRISSLTPAPRVRHAQQQIYRPGGAASTTIGPPAGRVLDGVEDQIVQGPLHLREGQNGVTDCASSSSSFERKTFPRRQLAMGFDRIA